jgi:hypothetical protein
MILWKLQRFFSDNQDNERLYTVLMNDDELRLYGEFQKEFNSRAAKERNRKYFLNMPSSGPKMSSDIELSLARKLNKKYSPEDLKIAGNIEVNKNRMIENRLQKGANNNLLNKGLNFAKNHKVGVGVAGAGLATAEALATAKYLKNKQKDKEE